ncbi:MAG: hypothetical protein GY865_06055 [candidate division Zixibacteria bacterium]|nr:hypothetical protein [candidate division Zixibacteria bacterium]
MKHLIIILLITCIFIGASFSFAAECGDIDETEGINILDIVHLINFVYKDGPDPICDAEFGTVTDIDGYVYKTVIIDGNEWMVENLKTTHYRNGDPIAEVAANYTWSNLSTGAYCEYDNDIGNVATYGRLYNWYAVNDSRNIAPEGWHVPSATEHIFIVDYLGGEDDAGGKMKEAGTTHWLSPNIGATNESGYTALPAGYRSTSGDYNDIGMFTCFWAATSLTPTTAWVIYMYNYESGCHENVAPKKSGYSVRCVKD